jgi:hypothetical protein
MWLPFCYMRVELRAAAQSRREIMFRSTERGHDPSLDEDALDLIQADGIVCEQWRAEAGGYQSFSR